MNTTIRTGIGSGLLGFLLSCVAPAATPAPSWKVVGCDRSSVVVLKDELPVFKLETRLVGHRWIGTKLDALPRAEEKTRVWEQKGVGFYAGFWDKEPTGCRHDVRVETSQTGRRTVQTRILAVPEAETQYSMPNHGVGLAVVIGPSPDFHGGACRVEAADGKTDEHPYPLPRGEYRLTQAVAIRTATGEEYRLTFAPPVYLHSDHGEIRLFASPAEKTPAGGTMTQAITLETPGETAFEPGNRWVETKDWIVYENQNDFEPGSVIGMEDWLEKPAGNRGWLKMDGDDFVFEDGGKVRFWGINISYSEMAQTSKPAEQWNKKWAKYGVNLVRLHKFLDHDWAGIMSKEDHFLPDPEKIKLFDLYHATARERGIYLGWSASYRFKLTPADKDRVWFYDEVAAQDPKELGTYEAMLKSFAPDMQDLLIAQTIALLTRTNSVTGIRYCDDRALAYIELHNEEDIFFSGDDFRQLEKLYPNYFKAFQDRFNAWLKKKYGDQAGVEKAWGEAYPKGTALGAIRPRHPSWEIRQKVNPYLADTMVFMFDEQNDFYRRFTEAIRKTGYGGAICGGCWQASNWMGHLFNTLSDFEAGFIDRHNYAPTPLNDPGVGNMSVGMQQVKGRPFNFSEWGGGPVDVPTVAVYGIGLQGWDASCQFSSGHPIIHNKRARACQTCCDDFIQIGQYPALARMIYRGDVKEGEIVANRRISVPDLKNGEVGIYEHFTLLGGANNKEFSSVVPQAALMAGRVVLEFLDGPTPADPVVESVAQYNDAKKRLVRSNTGQLLWDYSGRGYYTVNTPGTQAAIGHITGQPVDLADVTLRTDSRAPVKLYVTSLDRTKGIRDAQRLLITAFGRDANTGMVFDEFAGDSFLVEGGEPLLLEPLVATITLKAGKVKSVRPLDHAGRLKPDAPTLTIEKDSTFTIDGRATKTMYYLVEMAR